MEKIKIQGFIEVIKQGYSLNNVYILQSIKDNTFRMGQLDFPIGRALYQGMTRKGLISPQNQITELGEKLLQLAYSEQVVTEKIDKPVRQERIDAFDKWWNTYRLNDIIFLSDKTGKSEDTSILFNGTRGLRVKKEDCRIKFAVALKDYTAEELIDALKYEISLKIQESIRTKQNKLSFMQNSLTYLNQRTYDNFIEIAKSKPKEAKSIESTDTFI